MIKLQALVMGLSSFTCSITTQAKSEFFIEIKAPKRGFGFSLSDISFDMSAFGDAFDQFTTFALSQGLKPLKMISELGVDITSEMIERVGTASANALKALNSALPLGKIALIGAGVVLVYLLVKSKGTSEGHSSSGKDGSVTYLPSSRSYDNQIYDNQLYKGALIA